MKTILTKYLGPTNNRGSRIKAHDSDHNQVTLPYRFELDSEQMHRRAAEALRDKMGWTGELIAGGTRDGYVFVFKS